MIIVYEIQSLAKIMQLIRFHVNGCYYHISVKSNSIFFLEFILISLISN